MEVMEPDVHAGPFIFLNDNYNLSLHAASCVLRVGDR